MNKEILKYFKHLVEITERNNKNTHLEMQVGVEIPVEMAKEMLNIIEKQKEKEINLKKELIEQDELIEKLSRKLNEKTKRKIYIRRAKNEI